MSHLHRIMYIERKAGRLDGEGRIGWIVMSKSKRTYRYAGRELVRTGSGYKYNCIDAETGETYWVSGPRRDGADKLYGGIVRVDDDARVAYWTKVRDRPDLIHRSEYRAAARPR